MAERPLQQPFRKSWLFSSLAAAGLVVAAQAMLMANRRPLDLSSATVPVVYTPIRGGWALRTDDPRIGGLSGLEWDEGQLLAVTDAGFIVRLDPPGTPKPRAQLVALPQTAGNPGSKIGRDAESLRRDARGRGWWVAFEQVHSVLLYDGRFNRVLERATLRHPRLHRNVGAEALWHDGRELRWAGEWTGISDAVRLADGRLAAIERRITPTGFRNALVVGADRRPLPLGPLDNGEGIAAASLADGGTRLWMVTDDDQRPWRLTKLLKVDLPPQR